MNILIWSKNNWSKILSIFLFITLFGVYAYTFATPPATKYNAGETLDPTCIPGDTNCTVDTKPSQWITTGSDIYYNGGNVYIANVHAYQSLNSTGIPSSLMFLASDISKAATGDILNIGNPMIGQGINFYTGGQVVGTNERMTIAGNGFVGIGTTSPSTELHLVRKSGGFTERIDSYGSNSILNLNRASGSLASPTIPGSGGKLGSINFGAWGGSSFVNTSSIQSSIDANSASGDLPTNLTFFTTPDGSATQVERMRITNAGNIGINTSSPSAGLHFITSNSTTAIFDEYGTYSGIKFRRANGTIDAPTGILSGNTLMSLTATGHNGSSMQTANRVEISGLATENWDSSAQGTAIRFSTTTTGTKLLTERMRIDGNGNVGIGTYLPNASAILDLSSTSKGFLAPRVTVSDRDLISSPADGLLVYNTDDKVFNYFDDATSSWKEVGSSGGSSPWLLNGSNTYYSDGNVGIGIDNPGTKFRVVARYDPLDPVYTPTLNTAVFQRNLYTSDGAEVGIIGGTSGSSTLYLGDADNEYAGGIQYFNSSDSLSLITNSLPRLTINSDGNVGIGTNNPIAKLDIRVGELSYDSHQRFIEDDDNGDSLDDATFSGTYNQSYNNYIYVQIDSEGTPDTFSYWDDNGDCSGSNVSITGSSQYICDGISITFTSTTGHSLYDTWEYEIFDTSYSITNPSLKISDALGTYFAVNAVADNSNFIGIDAGINAIDAQYSNFLGYHAGTNAIDADYSNFFGFYAGESATSAHNSNFFGPGAGSNATAAHNSNFFGFSAGRDATYANLSNFFGNSAGANASQASHSNFFGQDAGYLATYASNSNFFGYFAGFTATNASYSNFIGDEAGHSATYADNSNFFGQDAGYNATSASNSNFLGYQSGYNATSASYSNLFGYRAGYQATNVPRSNFIGKEAGYNATSASGSNFIGENTGHNATSASGSNFIGTGAGYYATNATYSNFIGGGAGGEAVNASFSTLIGFVAGSSNIGTNNIVIGNQISLPDGTTNAINIGGVLFGTGTQSNMIPPSPYKTAQVNGKIGIAKVTPGYTLDVGNSSISGIVARFENSSGTCDINPTTSSLACSSDINLKKNITNLKDNTDYIYNDSIIIDNSNESILYKLNLLTPVKYNWNKEDNNNTKHIGFIAQEVEQVFPDLVSTDPDTDLKSISYTNFIPYTISAIQELDLKVRGFEDMSIENDWRDSITMWLSNASNKITRIFTGEICLSDDMGTECINRAELKALKEALIQTQSATNTSGGDSTNDNSSQDNQTDQTGSTDMGDDQSTPDDQSSVSGDSNNANTEEGSTDSTATTTSDGSDQQPASEDAGL